MLHDGHPAENVTGQVPTQETRNNPTDSSKSARGVDSLY
jgi:hypothetical protein